MNTTLTTITILNTFIKSDILTLPLIPPENHIKNFQKSNQMVPLKPPYNTLQFINVLPYKMFVPSEIWTHFYTPQI